MGEFVGKPSTFQKHVLNFDIDRYLNSICPRSFLHIFPNFISHWLGYRSPNAKPQPKVPVLGLWLSALIGGFVGIAIISNVFQHLPLLGNHQVPIIIGSFGAAAVLEYNTIESPLSQPRNLIGGHALSAIIGVGITKGFEQLPNQRFESLQWLAGSIAVGVASFVMSATKTVHPPAGATALLAATSTEIMVLGWWLVPLVLLASCLMLASALLVNNITRRWPLYWWTPADLSKPQPTIEHVKDVEKQSETDATPSRIGSNASSMAKGESRHVEDVGRTSMSETTAHDYNQERSEERHAARESQIMITMDKIVLPDWWKANDWENEVLQILQDQLQNGLPTRTQTQQEQ